MCDADADAPMLHLDTLGDDPDTLVTDDLEFHHLIAVGSGNPALCSLIDGLSGRTQRARVRRGLTQEDAVTQTFGNIVRLRQPSVTVSQRSPARGPQLTSPE